MLLMAARSGAVLDSLQPIASQPLDATEVTLVSDPRPNPRGWSAQGSVGDERVVLNVGFGIAGGFESADAGDRLVVSGTLRGSAPETAWAISRRIVGSIGVNEVHSIEDARGITGAANSLRDSYRAGVAHLDSADRALFTGLVFGDDRQQDPIDADNFRAAGLGHLLAVSGQNVAFVLLLSAPLLTRIRPVPIRVAAALCLLIGFGFLTRFEASVTRAIVMAGLALLAHAAGRPSEAAVVLPPAVLLLLALDPLLAWSLAFQLSVAATTGMVVLTPRIAALLPGPKVIATAAAATLGAQLFVAPLLLTVFGRLSLVAVPANLLAGPPAAGVMMWGLVAGPIAGQSPGLVSYVLHGPTWVLLRFVSLVAERFAAFGVGHFTGVHFAVLVAGVAIVLIGKRVDRWRLPRASHALGVGLVVLSVGVPLLIPRSLPAGVHHVTPELTIVRSEVGHDLVLLRGGIETDEALELLRTARLGRIDLLIATSGSRQMGTVVGALSNRFVISTIWAPAGHAVPGAVAIDDLPEAVARLGRDD